MIPWFIWAGMAALLLLACIVNDANLIFWLGSIAAGAMTGPVALGFEAPIWLELVIFFPALCLILAFIAGPPRDPNAVLPDNRSRFTRWSR
jgi:hypothetical protein